MDADFQYLADSPAFKRPVGAVKAGVHIRFRIRIRRTLFPYHVYLSLREDGGAYRLFSMSWCDLQEDFNVYETSVSLPVGLYFYRFEADLYGRWVKVGSKDLESFLDPSAEDFQLTVYDPAYRTPDWFKGGFLYQIMVDRFCRGSQTRNRRDLRYHERWEETPEYLPREGVWNHDFFGGDLFGVIGKLDYLRELGVTALYLCPIFEAASNHKYDTGDYLKIDEGFGGEPAFLELLREAEKRGIRVLLDGVFNHTGDDSRYFNKYGHYPTLGAYQSRQSPYYDWYHFSEFPDRYECWWGVRTLPALNKTNPSVQAMIAGPEGVIRHWMEKGAAGFRLDVVDELPDSLVQQIRLAVKEAKPDGLLLGEVWEDASNKISYGTRRQYFWGKELDGCMNYPLKEAILNYVITSQASVLQKTVRQLLEHYPEPALQCLMNILGTHDTVRLLTRVGASVTPATREQRAAYQLSPQELSLGIARVRQASLLQFTLPGVPCVFYGDEAGLQGFEDPFNRRTYPWGAENKDLLEWYRFLGRIRSMPVFKKGRYREILVQDGLFLFERKSGKTSVLIGINCDKNDFCTDLHDLYRDLRTDERVRKWRIPAKGYSILASV